MSILRRYLEGIFPSYAPSVYVGEEDEGSNISLDFLFSIGERGASPTLSSSQCSNPSSTPPGSVLEQASSSSSSRRHSVAETSAPGPFSHGIDQKAPRDQIFLWTFPSPSANEGYCDWFCTGPSDYPPPRCRVRPAGRRQKAQVSRHCTCGTPSRLRLHPRTRIDLPISFRISTTPGK